jgi:hypothetical protein
MGSLSSPGLTVGPTIATGASRPIIRQRRMIAQRHLEVWRRLGDGTLRRGGSAAARA